MNNKVKLYNRTWFMWFTLIFFAPVGIILMWKKRKFSNKTRSILSGVFALWFLIFAISANRLPVSSNVGADKGTQITVTDTKKSTPTPTTTTNKSVAITTSVSGTVTTNPTVNGQLKIHYIDVGQGDSELIQCNGQNMLIDTGTNASTSSLMAYLKSLDIKKIDYLVLTHPHEDHIGGADAIIKEFDIGTLYMNKVTTTTKTYKDVVTAIVDKGLKPTEPIPGATFELGDANCIILGPINSNDKDLNTYSIVIKVTFGNNKFLFTGDAQVSNEEDMITKGYDLSADILKVGHHGSSTSTSDAFLSVVSPEYAVISCGKGNDYGHPHEQIMDKLKAKDIPVYRTDENGTIVATSDGTNITFNTNFGDYAFGKVGKIQTSSNSTSTPKTAKDSIITATPSTNSVSKTGDESIMVWVANSTTKVYHADASCSNMKSPTKITLKEAKARGLRPCSKCNPPQ